MLRREQQRVQLQDVRYRVSQFFSVLAQAPLRPRARALHCVRESVGRCIRPVSRPQARGPSALDQDCLRQARPGRAAARVHPLADPVSVMFREASKKAR